MGFQGVPMPGVECDRRAWGFLGGRLFTYMRKRPPALAGGLERAWQVMTRPVSRASPA